MYRKVFGLVCLLGLPLAACDGAAPQSGDAQIEEIASVLEGVWERAEIVLESGPEAGSHVLDVQPSIYIFSKTHYAVAAVEGFSLRAVLPTDPDDAERGRAHIPYMGEMGTYTSADGKLTLTPLVTKDPAGMQRDASHQLDVVWDGLDVWLGSMTPDAGMVRTRLTRVDDDARLASQAARRLAGVWRRAEMIVGSGPDEGRHVDDVQPGYYIFTPRSFIGTYVSSFAPRPLLSADPPDAEWGRNYASFVSFGGAYALRNGELILRATAAQNPNNMRGRPFQSIKVEWEGDDVWFVYANAAGIQNRTRLVRVPD